MSAEQSAPVAPVSAPVAAAPVAPAAANPNTVVPITVNGKPLPFLSRQNVRGKGAEKNAPMFVAAYQAERPNWAEITRIATQVGESDFAVAVDLEIIRPLVTEASKQARVTNPDGTTTIDHGKFAAALKDLLAGFASNQSAKTRAQSELDAVEQQIVDLSQSLLEAQLAGKALTQADINKGQQLITKRAELQAKLKKGAKPAPTTVAATPAPAH
jgi:hypothetical protein